MNPQNGGERFPAMPPLKSDVMGMEPDMEEAGELLEAPGDVMPQLMSGPPMLAGNVEASALPSTQTSSPHIMGNGPLI